MMARTRITWAFAWGVTVVLVGWGGLNTGVGNLVLAAVLRDGPIDSSGDDRLRLVVGPAVLGVGRASRGWVMCRAPAHYGIGLA